LIAGEVSMMTSSSRLPKLRALGWRLANPILGSPVGSRVSEGLLKILFRGIGVNVGHELAQSGESWLVPRILECCPGARCADVGANVGGYTDLLLASGAGSIFAFEPVPPTFARLAERTANLREVTTLNVALGERSGAVDIHVSTDESASTLASRDSSMAHEGTEDVIAYKVPMMTLDAICFERELSFDFVKIDVEGFELEVLRGATRTLRERPPAALQLEFNRHHQLRRHHIGDYFDALPGYRLFRLAPRSLFPLNRDHYLSNIYTFQNVVAVRGDRTDLLRAFHH
jgi:FkbM family methyltransferase